MPRTLCRAIVPVAGIIGLVLACPALLAQATLEIGSPAPDFSLPGVDGKTYSLADFRDADILVIVFTCNHCPTAQAYEDRIKQLAADYKDRKVALVAISPNDPEAVQLGELGYSDVGDSLDDMKVRARDKGFTFPYLYDGGDQKVTRAYGPVATPHVFIFDRARKLQYVGRVDDSEKADRVTSPDARNAMEALLAGRPVPVEKTRASGCSVKWASKREAAKKALEARAQEEVKLTVLDEKGVRDLARNDGKNLRLIAAWATSCGPSAAQLAEFANMSRMYRKRGFELVTISADAPGDRDKALAALKAGMVSATNYLLDGGDQSKLLSAIDEKSSGTLPHTVLVAPGGKVLYGKSGPIDALELRKAIVGFLGRTYK